MSYLILERDDPGLHDVQREVADGLGDVVVLHPGEPVADVREQLAGDDEADVLVDDGLHEDLEAIHQLLLAKLHNLLQDRPVTVGKVLVRHASLRQLRQLAAELRHGGAHGGAGGGGDGAA